jgi:hypothetical protein
MLLETSVEFQRTTRRYILRDGVPQPLLREPQILHEYCSVIFQVHMTPQRSQRPV